MSVSGRWYDGRSSTPLEVDVEMPFPGYLVIKYSSGERIERTLENARLLRGFRGQSHALFWESSGSRLEFRDANFLSMIEPHLPGRFWERFIEVLETRWRYVLGLLVVSVILGAGFFIFGIPWIAQRVAQRFPAETLQYLEEKTFEQLENGFMEPDSEVTAEERILLNELMAEVGQSGQLPGNIDLNVSVWTSERFGANAIALPAGSIIVTREFLELSESPAEIQAVLAHEVAHVLKRHGLRRALENLGVVACLSLMIGDVGTMNSIIVAIPSTIIQSRYSQSMEKEADAWAVQWLVENNKSVEPMKAILRRVVNSRPDSDSIQWISSHPALEERLQAIEDLRQQE